MNAHSNPEQPKYEPRWIWVIYDHPKDLPDFYVARPQFIDRDGVLQLGNGVAHKNLDHLRQLMIDQGRACLPRYPDDDPVIIECWI